MLLERQQCAKSGHWRKRGEGSKRPKPSFRTNAMDTWAPLDHHQPRPVKETTMDVGGWLRSLGLGQYEAAFRDNEIDGAVLPKLTVEDLKDLGVAIVGHRRYRGA
jgi:hypothetical protein